MHGTYKMELAQITTGVRPSTPGLAHGPCSLVKTSLPTVLKVGLTEFGQYDLFNPSLAHLTTRDSSRSNARHQRHRHTRRNLLGQTLNHRVGGSSPSPPTYVSEPEFHVQTLDVVQTLEYWIYLPNLSTRDLLFIQSFWISEICNSSHHLSI